MKLRDAGLRFLTHVSYPFSIVLRKRHSRVHHANDADVHRAIEMLGKDPTVMDKVQNHDPSFGYNTAAGCIEEDSVQALEQIVSEKFGVAHNPCQYWREQDDGMHVLAAVLYDGYKRAESEGPQPYSKWFTGAVESGRLRGSALKETVEVFFSSPACHQH